MPATRTTARCPQCGGKLMRDIDPACDRTCPDCDAFEPVVLAGAPDLDEPVDLAALARGDHGDEEEELPW
jgi:hypothetical protein